MTLAQLDGGTHTARKGRPLKGGTARRVVQARMPAPLQETLTKVADRAELTLSDLGAYYMIRGWNLERVEQGLDPIPMPAYLEAAVQPHLDAESPKTLLDVAEEEETLLAG